jgi:nicotinate dehydrogenase subunit B
MPADAFKVSEGVVTAPDGRKLGYGELAAELDLDREVTATVAPKPPAQHTIVGRSVPRRDIPAKVTGGAAYVQDLRLSRMVHDRVVRPPHYGARLDALDEAPIRAMPGVIAVVRDGSFLGVVAEREEQAIKARKALIDAAKVDWRLRAARSRTAPRAAHGVADAILGGQREAGGG